MTRNLFLISTGLLAACSPQPTESQVSETCDQLDYAAKFIAGADTNDDGKVAADEFRMAMLKNGALELSEAQISAGFDRFDTDSDGELTLAEMEERAQAACDNPQAEPLFPQ